MLRAGSQVGPSPEGDAGGVVANGLPEVGPAGDHELPPAPGIGVEPGPAGGQPGVGGAPQPADGVATGTDVLIGIPTDAFLTT